MEMWLLILVKFLNNFKSTPKTSTSFEKKSQLITSPDFETELNLQ